MTAQAPHMPQGPVTAPITLAAPHSAVLPHSYMLYVREQECLNCRCTKRWSDIYAKTHLASQWNRGKYVTNLRPLAVPEFNLPIETIPVAKATVPFCFECVTDATLSDLPLPPDNSKMVGINSPEAKAEAATTVGGKPKPKTAAAILDLI